jgi:hypothetical protein
MSSGWWMEVEKGGDESVSGSSNRRPGCLVVAGRRRIEQLGIMGAWVRVNSVEPKLVSWAGVSVRR